MSHDASSELDAVPHQRIRRQKLREADSARLRSPVTYSSEKRPGEPVPEARVPESMQFLIFEDNGGDYHWTIVGRDGATLARSGSFASYDDAEKTANHVRDVAASALFERQHPRSISLRVAMPKATRRTPSGGWMRAAASAARRWRNGQRHADRAAGAARAPDQA
jgi:uncharacterized protein YegP (UPF0339 family)